MISHLKITQSFWTVSYRRPTMDSNRFIDVKDKYSACPGLQGQSLVKAKSLSRGAKTGL